MSMGESIGIKNLQLALARWTGQNMDVGVATGGTNTTADDTLKNWPVNKWAGGQVRIILANGQEYDRAIASNTATQLTFAALPGIIAVDAGDIYSIKTSAAITDISDRWARLLGQVDLARVLGAVLAHANPVIARLTDGAVFIDPRDVIDRAARLLGVVYGSQGQQVQQTAAFNLMVSVEEQAIALGVDVQARYPLQTIREIVAGGMGTFWLPLAGDIDLSNFIASSWFIYAPVTALMTVNCYLNISHDGGTTFRRAAGYEILDADFVQGVWNSLHCPLMLAETRLEVVIGGAGPATLDLMVIRKA